MNGIQRINYVIGLFVQGNWRHIWIGISRRIYSNEVSYGLSFTLDSNHQEVVVKTTFSIRKFRIWDKRYFRKASTIKPLLEANIPDCYVAVNDEDQPIFIQWLYKCTQNDRIAALFKGDFPSLQVSDALLEGGYTRPSYRGLGVMPSAIREIIKMEKNHYQYENVITFINQKNYASLKGIQKAGFTPYLIRIVRWRLFRKQVIFKDVGRNDLERYERIVGNKD